MFEKILIPLDGSPLAQRVLPHALSVAQAFDSEVAFLHVLEQPENGGSGQVDPLDWQLRKAEAQSYLKDVADGWAGSGVLTDEVLLEGSAPERIIEHADESDVDLIVLSSHGESGLSEWNISSVVQKTIFRAYRSLMLIRAYNEEVQQEHVTYKRIVLPLDGSQRAECVLPVATKLARAHDAELVLVHVVAQPFLFHRYQHPQEEDALVQKLVRHNEEEAERYLSRLAERIDLPVVKRQVTADNVAARLQDLVEEEQADLVMLSAHGVSGGNRPYGSIVTSFIAYGTTPLFIIQDLPQSEIRRSKAEEVAAEASREGGLSHHRFAYAQPAYWSYR